MQDVSRSDRKVFAAARGKLLLYTLFCAVAVYAAVLILRDPGSDKEVWGWVGLGFFGLGVLYFLSGTIRGVPKLILDRTGIRFIDSFVSQRWNWTEVGPFVLSVHRMQHRWRAKEYLYACASYRDNRNGTGVTRPTTGAYYPTGDVVFHLDLLAEGKGPHSAQAIVDEINAWRETHGRTTAPAHPLRAGAD